MNTSPAWGARLSPEVGSAPAGPVAESAGGFAPRASSLREAWRAAAWYASRPGAVPRDGWLDRALYGGAQVARAVLLLATDRALFRAAALPTSLTALACTLWATWMALRQRDVGAGTLHAFAIAFVAVSSMPPTLLQRMWIRVGLEARRALGASPGEIERQGEGYPRMVLRECGKALRQALVVAAGVAPLVALVEVLPDGRNLARGLAALWAGYWVILDAFEIPIELSPGKLGPGAPTWFERWLRRVATEPLPRFAAIALWPARMASRVAAWCSGRLSRPWRHEAKFSQRHPWETLGFGLAAGAFLALPGVGLFFRAVAMVAATALRVRLDEERDRRRLADQPE